MNIEFERVNGAKITVFMPCLAMRPSEHNPENTILTVYKGNEFCVKNSYEDIKKYLAAHSQHLQTKVINSNQ